MVNGQGYSCRGYGSSGIAFEDSISEYHEFADRHTRLYSWEAELKNLVKFYNREMEN
jgi:hypothetical protein